MGSIEELGQQLVRACTIGDTAHLGALLRDTQALPPTSLPADQYLLQVAAKQGQANCIRFLLDRLPGCRGQAKPWEPRLIEGLDLRSIPAKWRIYEDGVIHEAISGKDPIGVFKVLLEYGLSPDVNLDRAVSPLAQAVARNQVDLARYLLSKGADPNRHYISDKDTLLGAAARLPKTDMLDLLLRHGAQIEGSQALRQASQYGRISSAERLLEHGADVNEMFTESAYDKEMKVVEVLRGCALHFAVEGGALYDDDEVNNSANMFIRFLLRQGARRDCVDGNGETAAMKAKRLGRVDIADLLEEREDENRR